MNSRAHQENRNMKPVTKANNGMQPTRRVALNDLGNKMCNNHNLKSNSAAIKPSVTLPKKVVVNQKKNLVQNKKNGPEKENIENVKVLKKPQREESILLPKPITELPKINKVCLSESPKLDNQKDIKIYNLDNESRNDPQMVVEYIEDILAYLRSVEVAFPIHKGFLTGTKVTSQMRSILVNWLVDVHDHFSLSLDTLYVAMSILDRYSQVSKTTDRRIYQLVGATALLIASKYEEIYVPDIKDFVFFCDGAFTKQQFLQMESAILKKLDFRLGWPLSIFFLRRYSKIAAVRPFQYNVAKYLLELALTDYGLASVRPSIQAAAACCLALAITNEKMDPSKVWSATLVHYTSYKYSEFEMFISKFAQLLVNAGTSKSESIKKKYSGSKYGKVSLHFKLTGPLVHKLTTH